MAVYLTLWVGIRLLGRLPLRVLYGLADGVSTLMWYGSPRLQRVTVDHMLRVSGGAATPRRHARAARGSVRSAGRYWADMARAAHLPGGEALDRLEAVEGIEHFFEAFDAGCGVLFVSAHLGNPETLMRGMGSLGFDVLVLTEPLSPPRLHELVHTVRQAPGVHFVPADRSGVRLALEQLRAGGIVAMLADRDVLGTARPRPFFGAPARLPNGAVELALRTNAKIVTGFARRTRGNRMRVTLDRPIELQRSGDRVADVEAGMERLTHALEAGIGRTPEQWFALQPVWDGPAS